MCTIYKFTNDWFKFLPTLLICYKSIYLYLKCLTFLMIFSTFPPCSQPKPIYRISMASMCGMVKGNVYLLVLLPCPKSHHQKKKNTLHYCFVLHPQKLTFSCHFGNSEMKHLTLTISPC